MFRTSAAVAIYSHIQQILGLWVDYDYSLVTQRDQNLAEFLIGRKMKY